MDRAARRLHTLTPTREALAVIGYLAGRPDGVATLSAIARALGMPRHDVEELLGEMARYRMVGYETCAGFASEYKLLAFECRVAL